MQTQPIAYHIVLKLTDNRVIIDHRAKRVRAVRALIALGREARLLAFRFVDTHVHLEVACSRATAGQLARRLEISLRHALKIPVPFQPAFFEPVWRQGHLYNTFRYIHTQGEHHRVASDPLGEGSSLFDLLGLRVAGGHYMAENLRRWLPRLHRGDLLALLGVCELAPVIFEPEQDAPHLVPATTSAAALPDLSSSRRADRVRARCALLHAAGRSLSTARAADMLAISACSVRRLRSAAPAETLVTAIRKQLDLRRQFKAEDEQSHLGQTLPVEACQLRPFGAGPLQLEHHGPVDQQDAAKP